MTTEISVTHTISIPDELLHTIFVTAMEGGIGYWSTCTGYRWSKDGAGDTEDLEGFYANIEDVEEDSKPHRIDRDTIIKGVAKLLTSTECRWLAEKFFGDLDDIDLDAGDADIIVQLALFGTVVYG